MYGDPVGKDYDRRVADGFDHVARGVRHDPALPAHVRRRCGVWRLSTLLGMDTARDARRHFYWRRARFFGVTAAIYHDNS